MSEYLNNFQVGRIAIGDSDNAIVVKEKWPKLVRRVPDYDGRRERTLVLPQIEVGADFLAKMNNEEPDASFAGDDMQSKIAAFICNKDFLII